MLALMASAVAALGHGFRLPDQDAAATARGEAFAATANNPAAIYYNPAGITQLPGQNFRVGVYGLSLDTTFEPSSDRRFDTESAIHAVPQAYYTYTMESLPLSFGAGLYAPYGLGVEWPQDTGFRTLALKSEMSYLTLNPVVAWRVLPTLSVAAGPTFNYSTIELDRGITPIPGNDISILKGDAFTCGFTAGMLWQPVKALSFGVSYRSKTKMGYEGHTSLSFNQPIPGYPPYLKMDAQADLPFPQNIVAGVSFRPNTNWNFEVDVDWTDWDQVNTVEIRQMIPATLELNWRSSFYYEFGVTRYLPGGWHVSAGYIFNENSVPDATFTPLVPDQDRHFVSVGFGYARRHLAFDIAYQFGYGPGRTVQGSALSPAGQSADGEYEYMSHAVAISAGWHF